MDDVTCGVKTIMRPECLEKLLRSIRQYYPTMKVVVVDDGPEPALAVPAAWPHVTYIKAHYDTGLGACRNIMIAAIETPYTVYLDDDFVFIAATQLEKFHAILHANKADIVGGQYKERGRFRLYHGLLDITDGVLTYQRGNKGVDRVPYNDEMLEFQYVDIINNFFMGRTETLQTIGWDPGLKINTHTEFFIRASQQSRIAFLPEVHVYHNQVRHAEYNRLRNRRYREIGLQKHGIQKCRYRGRWG